MKKAIQVFIFSSLLISIVFLIKQCNSSDSNNTAKTTTKKYIQDTSTVYLPIRIDIASFEPIFNQQMDEQGWFFEEKDIEVNRSISLSFRVKKQGLAQLYPENGKIHLQLPLFIDIQPDISGPLSLGLGRDMSLDAKVLLKSAITVDLDSKWDLQTNAQTVFDIQESPSLTIAGFTIDFQKQLAENLTLGAEQINQEIEQQIKETINTKEIVNLVWDEIKTPYHIEAEPFDLWAMIQPSTVTASSLNPGGAGVMEIIFEIRGMVNITTGKRPIMVNTKKMPLAKRVERLPNHNALLKFPLIIPLETITNYLNQLEEKPSFHIQNNRSVTLSNFRAREQNEQLSFTANFVSKGTEGELELIGQPVFNKSDQTISIHIDHIATKSNNKIIDQLINSLQKNKRIKSKIEEKLKYSLEEDLAHLTFEITKQLKATQFHEYAKMNGYVESIQLQNVHLENNQLLLDTKIVANTVCEINTGKRNYPSIND